MLPILIRLLAKSHLIGVCIGLPCLLVNCGPAQPFQTVYVQGGNFSMGDPQGVGIHNAPAHQVKVSSFYISATEVNFGLFERFVKVTGYKTEGERTGGSFVFFRAFGEGFRREADASWRNPYFPQGPSHPVSSVSWNDALRFCNWLSATDGLKPVYDLSGAEPQMIPGANGWRLPTESEWEFAARGGTQSRGYKYSGSNELSIVAWNGVASGWVSHPVAAKAPNELGIYDMSGNLAEWCWDRYGSYPTSPVNDPLGADAGIFRVIRGGSWLGFAHPTEAEVNVRRFALPTDANSSIGFRVVRSAP